MFTTSAQLRLCAVVFSFLVALSALPIPANAQNQTVAPPEEYKFLEQSAPEVVGDTNIDIWAQVVRPANIWPNRRMPVVIFLHGNHGTCGVGHNPRHDNGCNYTMTGQCTGAYPIVTPNHLGYTYLQQRLAAWGYFTVSINANRGVNCRNNGPAGDFAMNLARGRLILKHLSMLRKWNAGIIPTPSSIGMSLAGHLDLNHVAIVGHSRGGEGARAAYAQYNDPNSPWPNEAGPIGFDGIFEIGPVDGQSSRVLNPDSLSWAVLLPSCDGDVSNLQGIKPLDRILSGGEAVSKFKSSLTVWGANHNFFNTEWQVSDSVGCQNYTPLFQPNTIASPAQQQIAEKTVVPFVLGTTGINSPWVQAHPLFLWQFLPQNPLPGWLSSITNIDRGYSPGASPSTYLTLENFTAGLGPRFQYSGVTLSMPALYEHDTSLRAGKLEWQSAGPQNYFEIDVTGTNNNQPVDIHGYRFLQMRVVRSTNTVLNSPQTPTDFSVQLVRADGHASWAIPISWSTDLYGPQPGAWSSHTILQTIRIPLHIWPQSYLHNAVAVRFLFDQTSTGSIHLTDIAATRHPSLSLFEEGLGGNGHGGPGNWQGGGDRLVQLDPDADLKKGLALEKIDRKTPSNQNPYYEISLRADESFPVRDSMPILKVGNGDQLVTLQSSRYDTDGSTNRIIFRVDPSEYARMKPGDAVKMSYGDSPYDWDFGFLVK